MSLVYWVQEPGGTLLDVTGRCRLYTSDLQEKAEEGAVAVNTLTIDDPDGSLYLYGHRIFAVEETEAIDPDNRFVYVGFMGTMKIIRGPYRTGAGRQWVCEISDPNTILSRRVMVGGGNERPEDESDNERITWLLQTNESEVIDDTRYVTSDNPEDMDEADYNLQEATNVWQDCAQQSGKNYFITYFGDVGVTAAAPWGRFSAWYDLPESDEYQSTAKLTNIESEVDVANGIFYIGILEETQLTIDPMRIYWRVAVPFKDDYVVVSDPTTADTYAKRDKVMPAENVKRKATAQRRGARYLKSLKTPEHRATVKTMIPRKLINLIRPGMGIPVRVSHWPGYEAEYQVMRVLSRRWKEVSEDPDPAYEADETTPAFEVTLELSRSEPGPPPQPVYGVLYGSDGPWGDGTLVYFARTGDNPGPGWEHRPKFGLIDYAENLTPPHGRPFYGFTVTGTGTINVKTFLTTYGIKMNDIAYTWTLSICKNYVPVATATFHPTPGNLSPQGWDPTVTVTGLAVSPGDLITARLDSAPTNPEFWRTPRGSGQNGERLEITGGSLS